MAGSIQYLRQANLLWVAAFVASHASLVTLRALRWRAVIRPLCPLPIRTACEIYFLGEFLNASFAMRTGDVAKAAMLRQQGGLPVMSGLSLLFADKIFELWGLISITALGLALVLASNESLGGVSVPVLAFYPILMIVMIGVARLMATDRAAGIIRPIAERTDLVGRVGGLVYHVAVGLRAAARMPAGRIVRLAGLSSFIYAIDGLSVAFLYWAIGATGVSLGKVLLASCMVALIFLIPVPGNIGTLVAGFAIFFGQLQVASDAENNAAAILFHASLYLSLLLLGLGSLRGYRGLMRRRAEAGAGPDRRPADVRLTIESPEIGTRT